ncbi:hypothetical protein GA0115252_17476 [Streptomyces sp. DfronAA-171]|nr:hypothetical protein GA0115252_17476 [Streptomyces sp. DfronAA-171]
MYVRTPAGQRTARVGEQGSVDHHSAQQFVLGRSFPAPDTCAFRAGAGVRPTRHSSVYLPVTTPSLRGEGSNGHLWRSTARGGVRLFCAVFRGGAPRTFFHGGRAGCGAAGGIVPCGGGVVHAGIGLYGGGGAGRGVRGTGGGGWARRGRGVPYGVAAVASPCGSWAARHVVRTAREPRGATWPRRYSPSRYVWGTATRRGIFQRRVVRGDATSRRTYGATRTRAARRDGATWRSRRDVSPARQRAWSSPRDVSPGSAGGPRRGRERRCRTRDRRPASRRGPRCRSRFPSRSRPRPSFPCRGGCRCASR